MKKISILLALIAFAFTDLVLASAVATSTTGNVTVQVGSAQPRPLRTGDRVNQGDTIVTGAASSAVLKYDDGTVTALAGNSRMTVTRYSFEPQRQGGSVLLSLVRGAMRVITGVIAKNEPQNVTVRAGTATIGIRGTDFTVVVAEGIIYAHVDGGAITFLYNGQSITIDTGRAALTNPNGTVSQGTINQIYAQLQGSQLGRDIAGLLGGLTGLTNEINRVFPGIPTQGLGGPSETSPGTGTGPGVGTPTGPGGGGGGRPASPS